MVTSLRRMIGMPVVWQGETLGYVERGVLTQSAKKLQGLVVRRGLGNAKWIPRKLILVVGGTCVLVCGETTRMPKTPEVQLTRAYLTTGECAGLVTDAMIGGETLRVTALEVSEGPLYHLMGRRAYATDFCVRPEDPYHKSDGMPCEIVASQLRTWAQVMGETGKEDWQ